VRLLSAETDGLFSFAFFLLHHKGRECSILFSNFFVLFLPPILFMIDEQKGPFSPPSSRGHSRRPRSTFFQLPPSFFFCRESPCARWFIHAPRAIGVRRSFFLPFPNFPTCFRTKRVRSAVFDSFLPRKNPHPLQNYTHRSSGHSFFFFPNRKGS